MGVARGKARSMARIIACVAGLGHDAARAFSLRASNKNPQALALPVDAAMVAAFARI
ncbi:hypothetical protein [Rudaea sp.]|uniref:hypothetical protein n=1 Tax=Rudaea sp. TaxID=2136325 RepID=UPI002ED2D58E